MLKYQKFSYQTSFQSLQEDSKISQSTGTRMWVQLYLSRCLSIFSLLILVA